MGADIAAFVFCAGLRPGDMDVSPLILDVKLRHRMLVLGLYILQRILLCWQEHAVRK
jgi:hypothetical protein